MPNNTMTARHDSFETSTNLIFDLVKKATSTNPISKKKIVKGYDNEVYEVTTDDGSNFILRIRRFGETSMQDEAWVIKQYKNVEVPIPQVLAVGTFQNLEKEYDYMIQEKALGQPLAEVKSILSLEQLTDTYKNAGTVLARMHQVNVGGFYKRYADGSWDFSKWYDVANSNVIDRRKEREYVISNGFTESEFDMMIKYLEIYRDRFTCDQPVLCHGDYLEEHIFVNEDLQITAIIDFGMYRGDHPIYDFARLYMDSRFDQLDAFIKGYGVHEMFSDRFEQRLLLHALGNQIGHLAYYLQAKMTSEINYTAKRLRDTYTKLETFTVE